MSVARNRRARKGARPLRMRATVEVMEPRWLLTGNVNEFPLFPLTPNHETIPQALITGPDGQLWFSPQVVDGLDAIGRMTTDGQLSRIILPPSESFSPTVVSLTVGQDGNVWAASPVQKVTTGGAATFIPGFGIPGEPLTSQGAAVLGPDGNLWTTQDVVEDRGEVCTMVRPGVEICHENFVTVATVIHRTTTQGGDLGNVDAPPPNHFDTDLIRGPDNAMWALASQTLDGLQSIERIDTRLSVTTYPLGGFARSLVPGPDGNVWFALTSEVAGHVGQNLIGRITPTGSLTVFPLGSANLPASSLAFGPDGSLWFLQPSAAGGTQLGRLFPATGVVQQYALPSTAPAQVLMLGPDGNLWFTEQGLNVLGQFVLNAQGNPASAVTGGLNPGSDTGPSATDGITNDTTPSFSGTANPGWSVRLYAKGGGQGAPIPLGFGTADASGAWKVTSLPLAEGSYTIFALALSPAGQSHVVGEIQASASGGPLVIDTTPPVVVGAVLDPSHGQVGIVFVDSGAGLDLASLRSPKSYRLARLGPGSAQALGVSGVEVSSPSGLSTPATVAVTFRQGRRLPPGRYELDVQARRITDLAGNALSGLFRGSLPTQADRPGASFRAVFAAGPLGASPPLPLMHPRHQRAGR